jgi:hypothetical protein
MKQAKFCKNVNCHSLDFTFKVSIIDGGENFENY